MVGKFNLRSLLVACLLCLVPFSAEAQDVRPLASAVDQHYNHLSTLQTEFTEIYRGDGAERTETGTLWLKKPRKMRWEYRSPREKLFVSDGKVVWFYLPAEKQLRKTDFRKLDDLRSPIAFLLGKTKLENELQGLSKATDQTPLNPANALLRGIPKSMADRLSEVVLEVTSSNQLARIVLVEVDGASTEFRFANPIEDGAVSDRLFEFTPPPGVETIDGNLAP
jgi:outer membrane lipoprotein carrier protein